MDNYMSCDSSTRSSARPEDCKLMRAAMAALIVCTITALLLLVVADAADPDPLQDFCVADLSPNAIVHVNGFPCKDRANVTSKDFLYTGMRLAGNVSLTGTNAVPKVVNVFLYPALNTLGISHARLDFGIGGVIPPHTHPFATETLFVVKGTTQASLASKMYYTQKPCKRETSISFPKQPYISNSM